MNVGVIRNKSINGGISGLPRLIIRRCCLINLDFYGMVNYSRYWYPMHPPMNKLGCDWSWINSPAFVPISMELNIYLQAVGSIVD